MSQRRVQSASFRKRIHALLLPVGLSCATLCCLAQIAPAPTSATGQFGGGPGGFGGGPGGGPLGERRAPDAALRRSPGLSPDAETPDSG